MKVPDKGSAKMVSYPGSTSRFQIQAEHKGSKVAEKLLIFSIFRRKGLKLKVPPDVFQAPDRGSTRCFPFMFCTDHHSAQNIPNPILARNYTGIDPR